MLLVLVVLLLVSLLIPGSAIRRLFLNADHKRQQLLAENEERIQRSQLFLQNYRASLEASSPARPLGADPEADVGLTVLTMARGRRMSRHVTYRTQYLTQSLARLLQLLNDTSLTRSYRLSVCDVDDRPDNYTEARNLEDLVPFFNRFGGGGGDDGKDDKQQGEAGKPVWGARGVTIWEKLKHDYVYCLQQTMSLGVRYALLVEDDAVAHVQLLPVLEHVLKTVLEAPGTRPVTYIKLFHPDRLLGYISIEAERLAELLSLAVVVGALLAFACTCRSKSSLEAHGPDRAQIWTSWLGWGIVVCVAALVVGRTNLLELRRLSPQLYQVTPTPSCCTPAMLFTREGQRDVSRYLLSVTCSRSKSTDFRLDEFRHVTGARALLVQPNLFTHIGLVSSLRSEEVNPLIVN
nr:hypothetical protein BaRGS_017554 [Batillaria attramentaria]